MKFWWMGVVAMFFQCLKGRFVIRVIALFLMGTVLVVSPVLAQGSVEDEGLLPTAGEGPKERFTREQAQLFALRAVPGDIIESNGYWQHNNFLFVFDVLTADGSLYEIDVHSRTGEILQIDIDRLTPGAQVPHTLVSEALVKALAVDYVRKKTKGKTKPKLISSEFGVSNRRPVYRVVVKKLVRRYVVTYDAVSAKVIKLEKLK